jgi:CBS domain-containing protein
MVDVEAPIRSLMSKDVVLLRKETTISEALATLRDYRLSTAPVVDERGECVGVFGLVDAAPLVLDGLGLCGEDKVSDWMTEKVKWIPMGATAGDAARLMADEAIHHVVVMDERSIRGVVSSLDLVRLLARALPPAHRTPIRSST